MSGGGGGGSWNPCCLVSGGALELRNKNVDAARHETKPEILLFGDLRSDR